MIELLVRRHFDHEPNATAVEEGQAGRDLKEEPHPELVAIEGDRAIQVLDRGGDLSDRVAVESSWFTFDILMRFILTPVGSAGDVHPFVGIGRALKARGHEVIVLTAGPFGEVVQKAGWPSKRPSQSKNSMRSRSTRISGTRSAACAWYWAKWAARLRPAYERLETAPPARSHRSRWALAQFLHARIRRSAPRPGGHDSSRAFHLPVGSRDSRLTRPDATGRTGRCG